MWQALKNVSKRVHPERQLFISIYSIYNDRGWQSKRWRVVQQLYNSVRFA